MTQQEVADALGISKTQVANIERRALAKLRAECERRGWTLESLLLGESDEDKA
jgi:DNA-directed RNA polymerase specialized sigma24 family protein